MTTDMTDPPVPEAFLASPAGPALGTRRDADLRSGPRFLSVFRPVAIRISGSHSICVIRNISSNGMCSRIYRRLPEGTVVSVGLSSTDLLTGQVAWSDGIDIGVAFDRSIDVPRFLKALAQPETGGRVVRSPRVRVQCTVELRLPQRVFRAELYDISQSGIRVETGSLRNEEVLWLEIPGLGSKRATVRWRTVEFAGLSFCQPIRLGSLIEWVNSEEPRDAPAAEHYTIA